MRDENYTDKGNTRRRLSRDDLNAGLEKRPDLWVDQAARQEERRADLSEAAISLEKVGVLLATILGLLGTAVTGWISLNQHLSDISTSVSTGKVAVDAKLNDLTEKNIDVKQRLDRLEEDSRRDRQDQDRYQKDIENQISSIKESITLLFQQVRRK